jgi:hypothetical protein
LVGSYPGEAYGDAATMSGNSRGGSDVLINVTRGYGDAYTMLDHTVGGNDRIEGSFRNISFGDAYQMSGNSRGGNDTITSDSEFESSSQYGDAQYMSDNARGGNDTLTGAEQTYSNRLYGDAQSMSDNTLGGNDVLTGGWAPRNTLLGDAQYMSGNARGGNDTLNADNHVYRNLFVYENTLYGDAQYMSDNARCGNDRLISGLSDNDMWGDAQYINGILASPSTPTGTVKTGADTFVFGPNNGTDLIHDFRQRDHDKIDVSAYGFHSLADLTMTAVGGDTKIAFDSNNSLTLVGISDPTVLRGPDFIFA